MEKNIHRVGLIAGSKAGKSSGIPVVDYTFIVCDVEFHSFLQSNHTPYSQKIHRLPKLTVSGSIW
jgi:hypothetical protein